METKEELLKRFKEERMAREKARIQMLHDLNLKKYNKEEEKIPKYFKPNRSLNRTNEDKSPVLSAINKSKTKNYMHQKKRVKNYFHVNGSFGQSFLNYSAPGERFGVLEDSTPRRKSTHDTAQGNLTITRDCPSV